MNQLCNFAILGERRQSINTALGRSVENETDKIVLENMHDRRVDGFVRTGIIEHIALVRDMQGREDVEQVSICIAYCALKSIRRAGEV